MRYAALHSTCLPLACLTVHSITYVSHRLTVAWSSTAVVMNTGCPTFCERGVKLCNSGQCTSGLTSTYRSAAAASNPPYVVSQNLNSVRLYVQVRLVDFSPDEHFLVSYSSQQPANPRAEATVLFRVFDCRTGEMLREFSGAVSDYAVGIAAGPAGVLRWPVFKWAGGAESK